MILNLNRVYDSSEPRSPPSLKETAEMVERLQCFLQCTLHEDLAMPLLQNLSAIESTIEKLSLQKFRQTNLFQFFKKVQLTLCTYLYIAHSRHFQFSFTFLINAFY